MVFQPSPKDFSDQPICNAVEVNDFKKALKLVEKRIAKKSTPYLLALKCWIQCNHPSLSERATGIATISDLAAGSDASLFSGTEELELYDEAYKANFQSESPENGRLICRMRVTAVKTQPKDEKLALACFRECLARDGLYEAQQIANSLYQNFPAKRSYQLWAIAAMWMFAHSNSTEDVQKNLCARLAYMHIERLAKSTAEAAANNPKILQSPQELLMLHTIISQHDQPTEERIRRRLELFQDPNLGPKSTAAKASWELQRNHLILLHETKSWQALFDECHKLLQNARARDGAPAVDPRGGDWLVWEYYIESLLHADRTSNFRLANEEVAAHQVGQPNGLEKAYQRNAALARVRYTSAFASLDHEPIDWPPRTLIQEDETEDFCRLQILYSTRLAVVGTYLDMRASVPSAFVDIKPEIQLLPSEDQRTFIRFLPGLITATDKAADKKRIIPAINEADLSSIEKITAQTTLVKLVYLVVICMAESARILELAEHPIVRCFWCMNPRGQFCTTCLKNVASLAIDAYGKVIHGESQITKSIVKTDLHPADDFLIVAAMCLIKLSFMEHARDAAFGETRLRCQYLLQAAALLDFGSKHSQANSHISLLLVRIYTKLGAGSLAMRAYQRLGIKQIQGDTLGYMLFDRISALHPHPMSDGNSNADPCAQLLQMQKVYKKARKQFRKSIWTAFENGNYNSAFQFVETSNKLARSITAAMTVVELGKIKSITEPGADLDKTSIGYDILPINPLSDDYSDNSDHYSFPSYEVNGSFERFVHVGPFPSSYRCRIMLMVNELWRLVRGAINNEARAAALATSIAEADSDWSTTHDKTPLQHLLTAAEYIYAQTALCLIDIVAVFHGKSDIEPAFLARSLDKYVAPCIENCLNLISDVQLDDPGYFPGFEGTLEPLYVSYELASLTFAVAQHLHTTPFGDISHCLQAIKDLECMARTVATAAAAKAKEVRSKMGRGKWVDFVLDAMRYEAAPVVAVEADLVTLWSTEDNKCPTEKLDADDVPAMIAAVCDADGSFLEVFAGQVVESWRDSVVGFELIKAL